MCAKERQRPVTLKRRIGYHNEKEEDEEDISDAARMKHLLSVMREQTHISA